ncbi:hypothetical protein M23134_05477 [Microscilla marina ATCC 23134]|uniref:Uncharacterized protein n=1 Tax=Microscilla marina ATCC 23134 TaxID=313606 RepID=A1ZHY7_MICM2|nr:hypothetical protein M23134_05477 [Microscilla marina ATCC 23134]
MDVALKGSTTPRAAIAQYVSILVLMDVALKVGRFHDFENYLINKFQSLF